LVGANTVNVPAEFSTLYRLAVLKSDVSVDRDAVELASTAIVGSTVEVVVIAAEVDVAGPAGSTPAGTSTPSMICTTPFEPTTFGVITFTLTP
jgi:hypothetical protein